MPRAGGSVLGAARGAIEQTIDHEDNAWHCSGIFVGEAMPGDRDACHFPAAVGGPANAMSDIPSEGLHAGLLAGAGGALNHIVDVDGFANWDHPGSMRAGRAGGKRVVTDGETYRQALSLRKGLGDGSEYFLEIPAVARSAGGFDGFIEG